MASKPIPKRGANGSVVFKLPFRLSPGGRLTSETFSSIDEAIQFGALVGRVGGQAARDIRYASTTAPLDAPTLRTAFEQMLGDVDSARARGTAPAPEYRRVAESTWMPALGDLAVDAITRDSLVKWVTAQRQQETAKSARARAKAIAAQRHDPDVVVLDPETYSPKRIRNAHSLLSQALATAQARGYVHTNVARAVLRSDHKNDEMVFRSEAEFALLLDEIAEHYQPLVLTLYTTGLRWGEATALTPGDLELEARTALLRVSRAWMKAERGSTGCIGSPKPRKARRTVSLPRQLAPILRPLAARASAGDLLFTTPSGTQVGQAHFHERVWTRRRGVRRTRRSRTAPRPGRTTPDEAARTHDLRHAHASLMVPAC